MISLSSGEVLWLYYLSCICHQEKGIKIKNLDYLHSVRSSSSAYGVILYSKNKTINFLRMYAVIPVYQFLRWHKRTWWSLSFAGCKEKKSNFCLESGYSQLTPMWQQRILFWRPLSGEHPFSWLERGTGSWLQISLKSGRPACLHTWNLSHGLAWGQVQLCNVLPYWFFVLWGRKQEHNWWYLFLA